jgi:putative membrane protein
MDNYYDWIKAFHVITMTAWMAGMFYLPRLFVYHAEATVNSEQDQTFKRMEKNLLRVIMNPAMILTIMLGLMLAHTYGISALGTWFHLKMFLVFFLVILHAILARHRKYFEKGLRAHSKKYYKILNESITVIFVIIVILVIVKPFE